MSLRYRDATVDDAPALAQLAHETFLATFGHLYDAADRDAYVAETYGAAIQAAEIADPDTRHRLAFEDESLIGYAKMGAYKLPVAPDGARPAELHRLYVVEAAKGRGVADALMIWTIEQARAMRADALYLGVYRDNVRAQRFYKRHGFAHFGEYFFAVGAARDPEFVFRRPL